jgi:membrane protease YdiL (CAAX protease family)
MAFNFGQVPIIVILLSFLELLLIIIPLFLSSKIEKTTFLAQIKELGFINTELNKFTIILQLISSLILAMLLYLVAGYILYFFQDILILNLFGSSFLKQATQNFINVEPFQPNTIELIILIVIQFLIVGPCEEGFFRAFLIKKLKKKYSSIISITLSSIMFTFYHTPPFLVPLSTIITFSGYYFIIGIALSIVFIFFRYSLLPCILVHSSFNVLILLL